MKLRSALLIATFLSAPVMAMAQPVSGLYVAGGVGINFLLQTNAKLRESTPVVGGGNAYSTQTGNIRSNGGMAGVGSIGWGFGNGLRTELELSGAGQSTRWGGFPGVFGGGQLTTGELAVNALYDFNVGLPVVPFVGIGVGYGQTWLGGYKLYNGGSSVTYAPNNSAKGGFMGNALLGAAYPIASVPGLAVTATYRFSTLAATTTFQWSGDRCWHPGDQRHAEGEPAVQQLAADRRSLRLQRAEAAGSAGSGSDRGSGSGPGPQLPGVLRLGQG